MQTQNEFQQEVTATARQLVNFIQSMENQKLSTQSTVGAMVEVTASMIASSVPVHWPDEDFVTYAHEVVAAMEKQIFKDRESFKKFQVTRRLEKLIKELGA